MNTKTLKADGENFERIYTKICEISIHTFDVNNKKDFNDFCKLHPKYQFYNLSIERIIPNEIFALWLPLETNNPNLKTKIPIKKLMNWFKKAKRFMTWKNPELFGE